jgi:hypothetical protein
MIQDLRLRIKTGGKPALIAEALSIGFFALVMLAASLTQISLIIFPELGALSSDVLIRPGGKWAKSPWKLILTPTLAAIVGVVVSQRLAYGIGSVLLTMCLCIGVVFGLRSAVAPAISAGVLALTLGITSWMYPICIFSSLSILTALMIVWRRTAFGRKLMPEQGADRRATEALEASPQGWTWFVSLFLLVAVLATVVQFTHWRFILFPPLIVMAFEMLGHPETCAWAKAPYTFPVVCTFAAGFGLVVVKFLGVNPIASSIVLAATFLMLRLVRLRMPPALAVGLIPLVIPFPSWQFPVSVAIGTSLLTAWFLIYRRVVNDRQIER